MIRNISKFIIITALFMQCCETLAHKNKSESHCYDYVIVGAGTAGAALAAKLSDPDPISGIYKNSVLVLESGINLTKSPDVLVNNILAAAVFAYNPKGSIITGPYLNFPFGNIAYPEGNMWGGSAAHNYLLTVRGTPAVYDQWAKITGDDRWSYANLLKNDMIPMEHYTPDSTPLDTNQRGTSGPLFITQAPPINNDPFAIAIHNALSIPLVPDYNNPTYGTVGVSAIQDYVTPPYLGAKSYRSFAGNAYLTGEESVGIPAIVDDNGNGLNGRKLKIISKAHANRVLFSSNKRAKAVEYVIGSACDTVLIVKAKKEIILCTGAFEDPAILQRSGIGDADLLNSLDIPVVVANKNVGQHLTSHLAAQAVIDAKTNIELPTFMVAFIGFDPVAQERQYQLDIVNSLAFFPQGIAQALNITAGINILGVNVTPASTGSVQIISRDPFKQSLINFNVYSDPQGLDAQKAINFYKLLPSIAAQAGGTVLYPTPADYEAGDDALFQCALATELMNQHASCTCRMAASAADGVVDGQLRVFGVNHLRIASNSVVPIINDGNTSYTADVIGREAARILRGE